jgi:hypothetical protein
MEFAQFGRENKVMHLQFNKRKNKYEVLLDQKDINALKIGYATIFDAQEHVFKQDEVVNRPE